MTPIPILFTIPNFITAGSGRAMLNIVERLDRDIFAPAVAVLKRGGNLDLEVERLGIPLIEAPFVIPLRPYRTLLKRARHAATLFKPYRFVLWHSFHYGSDYSEPIIARFSGVKGWVFTKKNMSWHAHTWKIRTLLSHRVVAQNQDMMRLFFALPFWRKKTCFIPRGVETTKFQPNLKPQLRLREQHKIASPTVLIGSVGHLLPIKGHATLIEAVASLPETFVRFAGKPLDKKYADFLDMLTVKFNVSKRVSFLNQVVDVNAFLNEIDVFVFPSKYPGEGSPVALLEAMACGKVCIATDVPGSRDLIEHDKSGLLVPPEDPLALAEALRQVIGDAQLCVRLGMAARQRVEDYYTVEREVADHEKLYREILGI